MIGDVEIAAEHGALAAGRTGEPGAAEDRQQDRALAGRSCLVAIVADA